jgi:hypothetical protein
MTDVFSDYDDLLLRAWGSHRSPWVGEPGKRRYDPDILLLSQLLTVPRLLGAPVTSGRFPKAFDAWIAYELRRARFKKNEVWPRMGGRPRVSSEEMATVEQAVAHLRVTLGELDVGLAPLQIPRRLRSAINAVTKALPTTNTSNILGRFYVKQVDVAVSTWDRGPDVLVSSKTQFAKYSANRNNRYEETLGEAVNLRDRYPLAAMGYAFIVGSDIFREKGSFARLADLLVRTRKPDGPYDATMLLIGEEWLDGRSAAIGIAEARDREDLSAGRFFEDLLAAVVRNTPEGIHEEVRVARSGAEPLGGAPEPTVDEE